MDGIIDGMKALFSGVTRKLYGNIKRSLEEKGIQLNDAQLAVVKALFENAINPFEKLGTKYQQDKYILEHLNYLVSINLKVK